MRRLTLLALVLIAAAPATAQAPASPVPSPAVEQTPATEGVAPEYEAVPAPATAGGLPARTAPPRTLRAYWHLFGAFAVTWVLLFGYALTLGRRMARLEGELRRLNG